MHLFSLINQSLSGRTGAYSIFEEGKTISCSLSLRSSSLSGTKKLFLGVTLSYRLTDLLLDTVGRGASSSESEMIDGDLRVFDEARALELEDIEVGGVGGNSSSARDRDGRTVVGVAIEFGPRGVDFETVLGTEGVRIWRVILVGFDCLRGVDLIES
jgi:hypothetical protein